MARGARLIVLRALSRLAVAIGALGSIVLMIVDGRSAPKVVLVLFVGWVASPWVILAWAHAVEARWSGAVRATLYALTLALVPLSLLIYARIIPQPAGTPNAFMFVATAPASWLLIATSLGAAALASRKRSGAN